MANTRAGQPVPFSILAKLTDEMFGELQAVVGMANETNRLATGYRVPLDKAFKEG